MIEIVDPNPQETKLDKQLKLDKLTIIYMVKIKFM